MRSRSNCVRLRSWSEGLGSLHRDWRPCELSRSAVSRSMNRRISSFILVSASAQANLNRRNASQGRCKISHARFGFAVSAPARPCTNAAILLGVDCLLGWGAHQGSRTLRAAREIRCAEHFFVALRSRMAFLQREFTRETSPKGPIVQAKAIVGGRSHPASRSPSTPRSTRLDR